jgi:membrane protein implicated in regulation of membrane protease activity
MALAARLHAHRYTELHCTRNKHATRGSLLDWQASTLWWLMGGVLVAAELATGTFYLLMLALGCAAGAVAAHLHLAVTPQIVIAAVVGAGATWAWHVKRQREPSAAPAASNRDVNIDIGQRLQVGAWLPDGTARVPYRGATWTVRWAGKGEPVAGEQFIQSLHGNELHVVHAAPARPH